jgi:hypothetical protein
MKSLFEFTNTEGEMEAIPSQWLDKDCVVLAWPSLKQRKVQLHILRYLATKFLPNRTYREVEVNIVLKNWHAFDDHALLRREMFDLGLLDRELDGSQYRRAV